MSPPYYSNVALTKSTYPRNAITVPGPGAFYWSGLQRAIGVGFKELSLTIRLGSKELFAWVPKSYLRGLQRVS